MARSAARGGWLLASSLVCIAASYGLERFSYELCHQGLPLAALTIGTPVLGVALGASSFFHTSPRWMAVAKGVSVLANGYQLLLALLLLGGVGIASCG